MTIAKYIKAALVQRIPILEWGVKYNSQKLISDTIAGVTVGLTVMPQALAYATLAGLEPQVTKKLSINQIKIISFIVWIILRFRRLLRLHHLRHLQRHHHRTYGSDGVNDLPTNPKPQHRLRCAALFLNRNRTIDYGNLTLRYFPFCFY